jgi:hypothetical protein
MWFGTMARTWPSPQTGATSRWQRLPEILIDTAVIHDVVAVRVAGIDCR